MATSTKVAVSCCNRLLSETITRILAKKSEFEVLSSQASSSGTVDPLVVSHADVLVLDSLDLFPRDLFPLGKASIEDREVNCVLVAMEDNHENFLTAIQRGVRGYVLRDASAADVLCAIRTVARGAATCPSSYTRLLFDFIAGQLPRSAAANQPFNCGLTRREQQLVPLLRRALTNKEIANQLGLSEQTVKNHVHRMMRKMRVSNRLQICEAWHRECALGSTKNIEYVHGFEPTRTFNDTEY
jgi:two-component system, NarL family, nitrate/nitrite response regulator NarL